METDDRQDSSISTATPIIAEGRTTKVKVLKPNETSYVTWTATLSAGIELDDTPSIIGEFYGYP